VLQPKKMTTKSFRMPQQTSTDHMFKRRQVLQPSGQQSHRSYNQVSSAQTAPHTDAQQTTSSYKTTQQNKEATATQVTSFTGVGVHQRT
jgi:hypothetical protein